MQWPYAMQQYPLHLHLQSHPLVKNLDIVSSYSSLDKLPVVVYVYVMTFHDSESLPHVSGVVTPLADVIVNHSTIDEFYRIMYQYPVYSAYLEIYWKTSMACVEQSNDPNVTLNKLAAPLLSSNFTQFSEGSSSNSFVSLEKITPEMQYCYVKRQLYQCGTSTTLLSDIIVPSFLDDFDDKSKSLPSMILRILIPVILLTVNKDEFVSILKPILLCTHSALFLQTVLICHDTFKERIFNLVFSIFNDSTPIENVVYWKFRRLLLELSKLDVHYGIMLRDMLIQSKSFQELTIDISLLYLDDLIEVINDHVSNSPNETILNHDLFKNVSVPTLMTILNYITTKLEGLILVNDFESFDTIISEGKLLRHYKSLIIVSNILSDRLQYLGFKDKDYSLLYIYLVLIGRLMDPLQNIVHNITSYIEANLTVEFVFVAVTTFDGIKILLATVVAQIVLLVSIKSIPESIDISISLQRRKNELLDQSSAVDNGNDLTTRIKPSELIEKALNVLWGLFCELSNNHTRLHVKVADYFVRSSQPLSDGGKCVLYNNRNIRDEIFAYDVILRVVIGKKDSMGLRELCLGALNVDKITDILPADEKSDWSSFFHGCDANAAKLINQLNLRANELVHEVSFMSLPYDLTVNVIVLCEASHL